MVVLLTSDLMMASTASSHARQMNISVKQTASLDSALEMIDAERPHMLLVDLQTPGLDIGDLGTRIAALADSIAPLTIGYAQHVEVEKLELARSAGFDQVLTRGQMNAQLGKILGFGK